MLMKLQKSPDEKEDVQYSEFINKKNGHLVIGHLSNAENTSNVPKTNVDFGPRIISTETWEDWQHREVIGLYFKAESLEVRRILPQAGIDQIWTSRLNPHTTINDLQMAAKADEVSPLNEGDAAISVAKNQNEVTQETMDRDSLDDDMDWSLKLVEYIFDMFHSSDASEVVGVISALEG
jgi:hypothetical protein